AQTCRHNGLSRARGGTMAGVVHRRSLSWATALAMLLALLTLNIGRANGGAGTSCQSSGVSQSVAQGKTPILFVHGINESPKTWTGEKRPVARIGADSYVDGTTKPPLKYVVDALGGSRQVAGHTFDWSGYSGANPGSKVMWVTSPPSPTL